MDALAGGIGRSAALWGLSACLGFICAYVVTAAGRKPGRKRQPGMADPLEGLLRRIDETPLVRDLRAREKLARRRAACLKQLPAMLDVVTLGLGAGLSFDASLELYCGREEGVLARAMREAMLSWRMGTRRRDEALRDLARDLDIPAFDRFSAAVIQALVFGSPLSEVLVRQADAIREEQRSQVAEEIERVPVKMLIPLGTLIVPAMLLAIMGPLLGGSLGW